MKRPGRNTLKRRYGPGIWEDADGHIHWSITELLAMVDLPDTPANQEIVKQMLREQLKAANPGLKIIERQSPED